MALGKVIKEVTKAVKSATSDQAELKKLVEGLGDAFGDEEKGGGGSKGGKEDKAKAEAAKKLQEAIKKMNDATAEALKAAQEAQKLSK